MDANANQKVSCIANYAYEASESDELSLRPGEVVKEVERLPGGWWRGELRGRRGMFPDNFVSVIDQANARSGGVQGRCRAVFSYQPANADELPLGVGDVLDVLGEVEEGWWQGRRQGRVGVFPSNFVVMLDAPAAPPAFEPAPALPPKPVKELCRVLFPYTAVNEDEITLNEGDIVTIVSKDAPDRGWWRGELHGRVGLFPDNFVQLLPPVTQEIEEKKGDRPPPAKSAVPLYPVLNKYSEKTTSVKELTTSKISLHKESTVSKESSTTNQITHSSKSETERVTNNEALSDGVDGQIKKPPVPSKKSPTPASAVSGLFSGLKSRVLAASGAAAADKEKSSAVSNNSSGSNSSGEWDKPDGGAGSRAQAPPPANTLDHVERNSILNDPRAQRVKAPRRRPPSQALRDDTVVAPAPAAPPAPSAPSAPPAALSNGHEAALEPERPQSTDKSEEIKPKAREWEKHRAPWMEELKLNQAKKTSFGDARGGRGAGSADRLLECGLEEKRSTHSMEMSKSTSSISNRISVLESFEETTTKARHSLDSATKKEDAPPPAPPAPPAAGLSPTAAGRTITTMLEDLKKSPVTATAPPAASVRTELDLDKFKHKQTTAKFIEYHSGTVEKLETNNEQKERKYSIEEKVEKMEKSNGERGSTLERLGGRGEKSEETLIEKLNNRITNLEKLLEVQNAKFNGALEELARRLAAETERRQALQAELDKLAHCVTQV